MKAVAVLAVLPEYRRGFVEALLHEFEGSSDELTLVVGDAHSDPTVLSGEFESVIRVKNWHLMGRRLIWQWGALRLARKADVVVVDLNPRSLTAWALIVATRLRRQRVLVWGHISPRAGAGASTAPLRRAMRRAAHGVISYTWSDAARVQAEDPNIPTWVAANGLYPAAEMGWDASRHRNRILYVGRLEPAKKPALAIEAFAIALPNLPGDVRLTFVGSGSLEAALERQVAELGVRHRVEFLGHISELRALRKIYDETLISVSPGYVGLSLTQSLGFGVAMLVADGEPHAPEVELLTEATGSFFPADDPLALAEAFRQATERAKCWDPAHLVYSVKSTYSAEAMADGFIYALRNQPASRGHQ